MTAGRPPKKDWYAIGWERGVEAARQAIMQASDVYDALDRIDRLMKPATTQWSGVGPYQKRSST